MDKEDFLYSLSRKMNDLIDYARVKYSADVILFIVHKLNRLFEDIPEFASVFIGECKDSRLVTEWEFTWGKILYSLKIEDDVLAGLEF